MLLLISGTARFEEEPWVFLKTWVWTCSPFVFVLGDERCGPGFAAGHSCAFGKSERPSSCGWVVLISMLSAHAISLLLDFLPLKCDACEQIFCTDHITYAQHDCTSAYKKDVQVPVCPLCNTPVPVRRGEMPDVVVGEHIDRDCKSDPAQRKRKIFTNKCLKPGCKQKEMMKVICDQCHKNYCLKHRHPLDHDCSGAGRPISKAGHATVTRAQASSSGIVTTLSSRAAWPADSSSSPASTRGGRAAASQTRSTSPPAVMLQNGLSEEEALQRALEMSLAESACSSAQPPSTQEEEDLALAQALSASEAEYQQSQRQAHGPKPLNCSMS